MRKYILAIDMTSTSLHLHRATCTLLYISLSHSLALASAWFSTRLCVQWTIGAEMGAKMNTALHSTYAKALLSVFPFFNISMREIIIMNRRQWNNQIEAGRPRHECARFNHLKCIRHHFWIDSIHIRTHSTKSNSHNGVHCKLRIFSIWYIFRCGPFPIWH